jgi:hypothetical protein
VMRSRHCVHQAELAAKSNKLVHDFSQAAAKELLSEFHLRYQRPDKSPDGLPTIYLDGPEEYIEHGGLVRAYDRPPEWLPKTKRFDSNGFMELRGPHKQHMVTDLFETIADNMTFYLAYGMKRKARFLSDMRGETEFLEWLNYDEDLTAKSRVLGELQHSVPMLNELSLATIVRIRKQEKEAFESYREAVTNMSSSILTAHKNVSKKQAREMLHDAIEPKLQSMKKELKTYQKVNARKAVAGIASIAATVLLGAYAGLPAMATLPMATAGTLVGVNLLSKAAEAACDHGPQFKQKNDLYFLLKLSQEAG